MESQFLFGRIVANGSCLAVTIPEGTVFWGQGEFVQAEVDLRDGRRLLLLVDDAIDLGGVAKTLLDGSMNVGQFVVGGVGGSDASIGQPLVNGQLAEGSQSGVEVLQFRLHQGRSSGSTGAVLAVLVRPELVVGARCLQCFPVSLQLSFNALDGRGLVLGVGATVLGPAAVVSLGPGTVDGPLVLVSDASSRLAEGFWPLCGQQNVIVGSVRGARGERFDGGGHRDGGQSGQDNGELEHLGQGFWLIGNGSSRWLDDAFEWMVARHFIV